MIDDTLTNVNEWDNIVTNIYLSKIVLGCKATNAWLKKKKKTYF